MSASCRRCVTASGSTRCHRSGRPISTSPTTASRSRRIVASSVLRRCPMPLRIRSAASLLCSQRRTTRNRFHRSRALGSFWLRSRVMGGRLQWRLVRGAERRTSSSRRPDSAMTRSRWRPRKMARLARISSKRPWHVPNATTTPRPYRLGGRRRVGRGCRPNTLAPVCGSRGWCARRAPSCRGGGECAARSLERRHRIGDARDGDDSPGTTGPVRAHARH